MTIAATDLATASTKFLSPSARSAIYSSVTTAGALRGQM